MRRANVVSGIVLAVFGLVMIGLVIPWQIEPGPDDMLSPRLMPYLMMILVTALSVLLVATNWRSTSANSGLDAASPISRMEMMTLLRIGALFAVSIGLYLWVSPLAAAAALVVGTLVVLGERRPLVIVAMPAGLLIAIWFLFYRVLGTAIV